MYNTDNDHFLQSFPNMDHRPILCVCVVFSNGYSNQGNVVCWLFAALFNQACSKPGESLL